MVASDTSSLKQRRPRFLLTGGSKIRSRRLRYTLLAAVTFGIVAIILLSTLLTRDRENSTLFKKTSNLSLKQGTYLGQVSAASAASPRAIQSFLGVPYAQSTADQNRFKPAQALTTQAQNGVVTHALKYGQVCPQGRGDSTQGEDCLNANIYRPHFGDTAEEIAAEERKQGVNSTKLPVVVYVHGGGFNMGSGKERDMASFAAFADSPIVTLSFNYRVGAFGFLPSAVTEQQGLLNLGLKDQQFFFEWLRSNLPDIGGDPDNVTIMGLSAGAHSIGHHLISYSPANKLVSGPPPFQKAILESGAATARAVFVPNHPLHEQQFQEFLTQCGLNDDNVSGDELFSQLRNLPYATLVAASNAIWRKWSGTLHWPFQPVIDGAGGVIPDLPVTSWAKGNVLRIPILTGFNTNEGATFVPQGMNSATAVRSLMTSLVPALTHNKTALATLDELYPNITTAAGKAMYASAGQSTSFGTQFWRLDDAYAHYAYICPVLQTATLASTAKAAAPVYVYHFAARSGTYGAADHGDETPVVTHDMSVIGRYPGLVATADAMAGAWSRFAVTGDPNLSHSGARAPFTWPPYASPFAAGASADSAGRVALFGAGNDERMGAKGTRSQGTPAQAVALTERNKAQTRFWWPRVVFSEGYGNGTASIAPEKVAVKAKL
ncbi:alpha/beta-hydrolase [Xylariaceae sp. FL1651]|nr:alpha/beta-hydrolase [Xylariaceae sp. FL1651]